VHEAKITETSNELVSESDKYLILLAY
jgi:hypothetical protein